MPLPKVRQLPSERSLEWPYGYFSKTYFHEDYFDTTNMTIPPVRVLPPAR